MAEGQAEALRRALREALEACERELDRRNATVVGSLARRMEALRRLLDQGRLPRVAAVGRRGAGKSSLVNAILGRPALPVGDVKDRTADASWRVLAAGSRRIEWLDTPGLRAGGQTGRRREVVEAVRAAPPDVLLVLCQATEVDAGVDDDLQDARAVAKAVEDATGAEVPVLGVVTKVDELAPADVTAPPFDDPEKRANIQRATSVFHRHLRRSGIAPHAVLPVASYAEWNGEALAHDGRWNIDMLVARIQALLPDAARLRGALLCTEVDVALRELAGEVTEAFAALAFTIGSAPSSPAQRAELARVEDALVAILGALATRHAAGEAPPRSAAGMLRRAGAVLGALRTGLGALGARRAGGYVAAARVRALGRALVALEMDGVDPEVVREMFA